MSESRIFVEESSEKDAVPIEVKRSGTASRISERIGGWLEEKGVLHDAETPGVINRHQAREAQDIAQAAEFGQSPDTGIIDPDVLARSEALQQATERHDPSKQDQML